MRSGTMSVLFAEHNFVHALYVIKAWKRLYFKYPKPWQIVCIFLHDIGLIHTNYLETLSNDNHELLGARIAGFLFGQKGFDFIYHHRATNPPSSLLEAPDDYSWCLCPIWWLHLCWLLQKKKTTPAKKWKLLLCERWIRRFNGEEASSLWNTVAIKQLKEVKDVKKTR